MVLKKMRLKKTLHLREIEAVLFDMDGTMINNISYHKKAWDVFIEKYGISLTDKEFKEKTSGKMNKQIMPDILEKKLDDKEIKQLVVEKESIYRKLYAPHVEAIEGLLDFIKILKKNNIKIAVTTMAIKENRQFILRELRLIDKFDVIVGEEHFTKGKPDPEIFLTGAERLGVDPRKCVVFEDAPLGIEAARRAGMKAIGVLTSHTRKELKNSNFVIHDFLEIRLDEN